MAKIDSRPPDEILKSISTKALDVRTSANELSKRIEKFQEFLGKLPGRVETEFYGSHPDATTPYEDSQLSLVLRLHREGKSWILSYGSFHEQFHNDPDESVTFAPLMDAPLRIKIAAVKIFPNMLAAIEKSQDKLVSEIQYAVSQFDIFAASLPTVAKEGK